MSQEGPEVEVNPGLLFISAREPAGRPSGSAFHNIWKLLGQNRDADLKRKGEHRRNDAEVV